MPDVTAVLAAFRAELVAAGLVRRPSEAAPDAPPMVIENRTGAPEPGAPASEALEGTAGEPLVLHLSHSVDVTPANNWQAAWTGEHVLDLRYRAKDNAALRAAFALDLAIVQRLFRPETNYGYGFELGGMWVRQVSIWGAHGRLGSTEAAGFDSLAKYVVEVAR